MPESSGIGPKIVVVNTGADRPEAFGRGRNPEPEKDGKKDDKGGDDKSGGGDKKEPKKPFYKRPVLMAVLLTVLLAAVVAGTIYGIHSYHFESTDDAFIDGRIARIAPRVSGKVLRLAVEDNQAVSADTVLVEIDPQPFQVKIDEAAAAVAQSEAQAGQARANKEVAAANAAQADADVDVSVANAKNAQEEFDRYARLSREAKTLQQVDLSTANQRSTAATVISAQKKAESMHAQVTAADKMIKSADAGVAASNAQLEQAKLDLSYTQVKAGHSGRVTRRTVEVGNYVSVGQEMLDIVPTDVPDDVWVTANFKETQLAHMERGQKVSITVDAFPDEKLEGTVDSIQNGTGAVFSLLPPENATGNYVKVVQRVPVKIVLRGQPRHLLSPGMSVTPEVDVTDRPDPGMGSSASHEVVPAK